MFRATRAVSWPGLVSDQRQGPLVPTSRKLAREQLARICGQLIKHNLYMTRPRLGEMVIDAAELDS